MKRYFKFMIPTAICLFLTACSGQQAAEPEQSKDPATSQTVSIATGENTEGTIEETSSETSKDTVGEWTSVTGRYLTPRSGDGIIVIDNYGPVTFTDESGNSDLIHSLHDGDLIRLDLSPIMETYPGQAVSYGCELIEKGNVQDVDPYTLGRMVELGQITTRSLSPMVYSYDRLFISSGRAAYLTCQTADGEILSSVKSTEIPGTDKQSNFGTGASYILLGDGALAVKMDQTYILFLDTDTVEYNHQYYKK